MKYLIRFIFILTIASGGLPGQAQASDWRSKIDPRVLENSTHGETEFLIFLTEQADVSGATRLQTKLEKSAYVVKQLDEVAQRTQPAIIAVLNKFGAEYRAFRVANLIWARGGQPVIRALAERKDVARLYANPQVRLAIPAEPALQPEGSLPEQTTAPEGIEWNISKVNAPQVWAAGFTGQGTVIAGQDTGYVWDHPALISHYRGWNGVSADHNYNWHDAIHHNSGTSCLGNSPVPCDVYGHGTHTMGIMVGDDGGTNQIGMAPGAKWIGCRNMDNYGNGTPASYTECFDWFLAPYPIGGDASQGDPAKAPDVVNNSWTCTSSEGCSWDTLYTIVNNVRAAGIVVAAAASNSGPSCSTITEPPALYGASFTVGATDSGDSIASFSSRGPVLVDGSNRLKPDISAPGVSVRSSVPSGYGSMSGTSMATPHVAGLVGLLISAQPALRGQVDEIETLIERTAVQRTTNQGCGGDSITDIPNNTYGWGRIDALAAIHNIPHTLLVNKTASAKTIPQGEPLTYTITITHTHPFSSTTDVVLTDTIPTGVSFLDATRPFNQTADVIEWDFPSLGVGESRQVTMTVGVPLTLTGNITNALYGVRSDDVSTVAGSPVVTEILLPPILSKIAPERAASGELLTYHLTAANTNHNGTIHDLVLTDTIPANTIFITATQPYSRSDQLVTWQLPALAPDSQWVITLTVQTPIAFTGMISNTDYGFSSQEFGPLSGPRVETRILLNIWFPFMAVTP